MAKNFLLKFQCYMEFSQICRTDFKVTASLPKCIFLASHMLNLALHLSTFLFFHWHTSRNALSPTLHLCDKVFWCAWKAVDYCFVFHLWRSLSSNVLDVSQTCCKQIFVDYIHKIEIKQRKSCLWGYISIKGFQWHDKPWQKSKHDLQSCHKSQDRTVSW